MAWNATTATGTAASAVTILEGSSFCISDAIGNVNGAGPEGAFYLDTRIISVWQLSVVDHDIEHLGVYTPDASHAHFIGRLRRHRELSEPTLVLNRSRDVGAGLRETIEIWNHAAHDIQLTMQLTTAADFADLFEVKLGAESAIPIERELDGEQLVIGAESAGVTRSVSIRASEGFMMTDGLHVVAQIPARGSWHVDIVAVPQIGGETPNEPFLLSAPPGLTGGAQRRAQWRDQAPLLEVDDEQIRAVLDASSRDLSSLRIFDHSHPGRITVAAGAPWFMALFGRDSILTSLMSLPIDRAMALGTLQNLAELQGTKVDPKTEEEPGRILHEVRFGAAAQLALGGGAVYYGTADATPLFVVLLEQVARWGAANEQIEPLLEHADRALEWIDKYGDSDGDGFVEYSRYTETGLLNQGWKDSWDGVTFADGSLPAGPIALCEVQGYVYAAFLARSHLATRFGDEARASYWRERAEVLRQRFNKQFWLPELGWYALALDGEKRPVDALASNMGHCMWTGIIDPANAASVVRHLMSPEMFSGWGIRTLATTMGAYNPVSYHNGSVWPHDNALIAAGIMRYGFVAEAQRLANAIFDTATEFGARLPELFCGFAREDHGVPIPYPTSCSPQAWASATPIQLLTTLLRFEPALGRCEIYLSPALPPRFGWLHAHNVLLGDSHASISVSPGGEVTAEGLPFGVEVINKVLEIDELPLHARGEC